MSMRLYTYMQIQMRFNFCSCEYRHIYKRLHIHMQTYSYIHIVMSHTCVHTCVNAVLHANIPDMHACIQTYIQVRRNMMKYGQQVMHHAKYTQRIQTCILLTYRIHTIYCKQTTPNIIISADSHTYSRANIHNQRMKNGKIGDHRCVHQRIICRQTHTR